MKKWMILFMAVLLCGMSVSALAEDTQLYSHPTEGYSISVPAQWLCVDKSNLDALIAAYEKGEMTFTGTNANTLREIKAQVEGIDCAVLINPHANNIVITKEKVGVELTIEQFVALVVPMLRSQLQQQLPGLEFTSEGDMVTLGENKFAMLAGRYSIDDRDTTLEMLYYLDGADLYTLTLTPSFIADQDIVNAFYGEVVAACRTFTVAQ